MLRYQFSAQRASLFEPVVFHLCLMMALGFMAAGAAAGVPDPPLSPNFAGTCTNAGNQACDVTLNNCTSPAVCELCGQNKYISFEISPSTAGTNTAVRIKLTSLHHPSPPPWGTLPSFSVFEGQSRYLNAIPNALSRCCDPSSNPLQCNTSVACGSDADCGGLGVYSQCETNLCPDQAAWRTFFRCARVACSPEYRDWGSEFSGLVTYATGNELIIPSSVYHLSMLADSCAGNEESCAAASPELEVKTERWGNMDCSNGNNGIPSAADCARPADWCRGALGSKIKPQVHIRLAAPDPLATVNAQDIGRSVDATKGNQYPFSLKCTTSTACTTDGNCSGSQTCSTNGFCTAVKDSCSGLCQP